MTYPNQQKCRKCGQAFPTPFYNAILDRLLFLCKCGYWWYGETYEQAELEDKTDGG